MIKVSFSFLTLCLLFNVSSKAQSTEEKEVLLVVENLRHAMIDGNKQTLENLTATDLSYGHSSGKVEDKAAFVENIASGKSDFVTINLEEQTIKVVGDVALVRHKLTAETNDGGKPATVNLKVLLVWQKQNGTWKLLARQAVKILAN